MKNFTLNTIGTLSHSTLKNYTCAKTNTDHGWEVTNSCAELSEATHDVWEQGRERCNTKTEQESRCLLRERGSLRARGQSDSTGLRTAMTVASVRSLHAHAHLPPTLWRLTNGERSPRVRTTAMDMLILKYTARIYSHLIIMGR